MCTTSILYVTSIILMLILSSTVFVMYFHRWVYGQIQGFARKITLGISLTAFGTTLLNGLTLIALCSTINASWLFIIISFLFIMLGYGFHLYPFIEVFLDENALLGYFIGITLLFIFILQFQLVFFQ